MHCASVDVSNIWSGITGSITVFVVLLVINRLRLMRKNSHALLPAKPRPLHFPALWLVEGKQSLPRKRSPELSITEWAGFTAGVNILQAVVKVVKEKKRLKTAEEPRRSWAGWVLPRRRRGRGVSLRVAEMDEDSSEQMRPLLTSVSSHFPLQWTC